MGYDRSSEIVSPQPGDWRRTSHHPGFQPAGSPAALATETGDVGWIPVSSSNVEAIRWVEGDEYPLQVKFLAKPGSPSTIYGYQTTFEIYDEMFSAGSMGRFVWKVLRDRFEYKRLA